MDPEARTDVEDHQVDDTAKKQRGYNATTQTSAENYGDPSGKMWSMYLTEAKKDDVQMTENWKGDAEGILVFTGLFSATVASFIVESYKELSPDPGDQTVALLAQISSQLTNISLGAPLLVQNSPPFQPPASIVRVNVMWFLSLILSLSCALFTTLMQQWARRYLKYAQRRGPPRKRARIRAYMFEGVEKFRLSQAVEAVPLLLHISVFLFFAGLIDFLFHTNKAVAFSAIGCVVTFALIYAILTLLPSLHLNSPYRTPLSGITYISFQLSALNLFSTVKTIEGIFHGLLLEIKRWSHSRVQRSPNDWPTKWKTMLEDKVSTHYERFLHGLRWRIELGAMEASPSVDASALHWTLTALDEDKEFEDFASRIPGFFDSRASPDATSAMLSLLSEQSTSDPILGFRLYDLLKTCQPGISILTEEQRKNRLRVCLKSLWYCGKAYNLPENSELPLAPYVRSTFASPEVIGWIRTEQDSAARLVGRCFGALVAKKLASDITSPTRTSFAGITAEMARLSYILSATGEQVNDWLGQEGAIDLANVISLASGEVASGTKGVPIDVVDMFQQTLGIIAEGIDSSHADANVEWDVDQVARFHEIYSKFANAQIPDVLKERLRYISDRLPPISYVGEAKMKIPGPEPDSETIPFSGLSQKRHEIRVRIGGAPGFVDGCNLTPTRD
ncbi:hypothetical protein EDB92DRAFT_1865244 [Lactarius akahatsu]|uniref:DUF6535 domain-containing protein n=1 Tax=Lactarius akahatsu TaxID=416441 RepID=A0AAD4QD49_9AGAM|nr:hypothetical protein EDB92DRAFT_1865244 [Lactarius akahatsu]